MCYLLLLYVSTPDPHPFRGIYTRTDWVYSTASTVTGTKPTRVCRFHTTPEQEQHKHFKTADYSVIVSPHLVLRSDARFQNQATSLRLGILFTLHTQRSVRQPYLILSHVVPLPQVPRLEIVLFQRRQLLLHFTGVVRR